MPTKAGRQIYYQYGQRSDDFLVDNYGFCLDPGDNPFSAWKFRVVISSKVGAFNSTLMGEESVLEQLLPNESVYAEYSKIEDRTELIAVQDARISEPLFEYLRSVL